MSKKKVAISSGPEEAIALLDQEVERIESNPVDVKERETYTAPIFSNFRPIYAKVTLHTFDRFLKVCKREGVSMGDKLTEMIVEYAKRYELREPIKTKQNQGVDWKKAQANDKE